MFIKRNIIDSSSLSFQEDDALIFSALHYPNPVSDWSLWSTITFFALKLFTSASESAMNLYCGITKREI